MKRTTTPKLNDVEAQCSAVQLSAVLGVSVRQIHHCEREGVLKPATLPPLKRYKLAESVQSYLRYSRELAKRQCSSGGDAYDVARAQRMASLAKIEAIRLQQLRGEVMSRQKVMTTVTLLLSATRNHVLGLPTRCSRQLVGLMDQARIYDVLDNECRGALLELSQFSVEDYIRVSRQTAAEEPPSANGESESD